MYQLEVKRSLVEHRFSRKDGWSVTVDVDSMERANGGQHPPGKKEAVGIAESWLRNDGVEIGTHRGFGRADIVATKRGEPLYIVEVEGESKKPKAQAMYSALGQTILMMREGADARYAVAVPDTPEWERQLRRIPTHIRTMLTLDIWFVCVSGVRSIEDKR